MKKDKQSVEILNFKAVKNCHLMTEILKGKIFLTL